jgi:hypothetical protein
MHGFEGAVVIGSPGVETASLLITETCIVTMAFHGTTY